MGQLGDVLEILFGPDDHFQTVRATIRHWCNHDLAGEASGRRGAPLGRKKTLEGSVPKPPKVTTSTSTIWLSQPASARIQERAEVKGCIDTKLTVTDGNRRWECDSEGHVETKEGEGERRTASGCNTIDILVDRHFNPAQIRLFLERLALLPRGLSRIADRECVRLSAIPRPGFSLWPHWLPHGADEYKIDIDLERALFLNIVGHWRGQVFALHEVTAIAFDEPLEQSLFVYEPRPGQQVAPAVPVVERLSLEAAIARMPFTVLVPTRVPGPEHADVDVMFHPPRRHGGWSHLALMYRGSHAFGRLWVNEGGIPGPERDDLAWERIVLEGSFQNDLRISDPGEDTGVRIVAFEQQGTHVTIMSDLDRAILIDFARSFTAAPGGKAV